MSERRFLFILGSARRDGNTEHLARRAAASLPKGISVEWLHLADHPLPLFEDIRHHESRKYAIGSDHERTLLDATLAATDIVVASPVYWYSLSAATKLYIDHWSGWMRLPDVDFRKRMAGKTLWGVAALSDESDDGARPLVDTLHLTADYLSMNWGGVLLGFGNRPGDVVDHEPSITRAKRFFRDLD